MLSKKFFILALTLPFLAVGCGPAQNPVTSTNNPTNKPPENLVKNNNVVTTSTANTDKVNSSQTIPENPKPPTLTPAQIMDAVVSQHGLVKDDIGLFTVYGQDRASFGYHYVFFHAYKEGGQWKFTDGGVQDTADCSIYNDIPEKYRPMCIVTVNGEMTDKFMYADSDGQSLNYPPKEGIMVQEDNPVDAKTE